MTHGQNNYAYIDAANLHKGVGSLGWRLDYKRFRIWLRDKYSVAHAYLFIGLVPKYKDLYTSFRRLYRSTVPSSSSEQVLRSRI